MTRFYADENFRYPVVAARRRLGHDVLTCQEAGRAGRGIGDDIVLSDALEMGRVVLTENLKHFNGLHNEERDHQGIVVCTFDRDTEALARRIDEAVAAEQPGGRWLVRVDRPHPAHVHREPPS